MRRLFLLILGIVLLAVSVPALVNAQQASPGGALLGKHLGFGLNCASCHKENPPSVAVKMEQCFTCHGDYDKLADKTDGKGSHNPHASHNGDLPCESCHHMHMPSVNFCAQCHQFEFNVP